MNPRPPEAAQGPGLGAAQATAPPVLHLVGTGTEPPPRARFGVQPGVHPGPPGFPGWRQTGETPNSQGSSTGGKAAVERRRRPDQAGGVREASQEGPLYAGEEQDPAGDSPLPAPVAALPTSRPCTAQAPQGPRPGASPCLSLPCTLGAAGHSAPTPNRPEASPVSPWPESFVNWGHRLCPEITFLFHHKPLAFVRPAQSAVRGIRQDCLLHLAETEEVGSL